MRDDGFKRTHYASQLSMKNIGNRVRIAGWIEDVRLLGAIAFITIRDVTGIAQAVVRRKESNEDIFTTIEKVTRQSVILVEGIVNESRAKDVRVEVEVDSLHMLSEARHPMPIDPSGRVNASLDAYLNFRALSLRNPCMLSVFKIRHSVLQFIRDFLIKEGFIEVNTSKIIGQAAEGGANMFPFNYFGDKAYLAQSPQLYKEQLTLCLDRVFEIAGYFRAEKSHTPRHLNEFISVDVEAAFSDEEDVMGTCEQMVARTIGKVREKNCNELRMLKHSLDMPSVPFERVSYAEAIQELKKQGYPLEMGEDLTDSALRRLARTHSGFYFIIDWPADLKPFYIERKAGNLSRSFDLQYGHIELASGGMRVSDGIVLKERIINMGLKSEEFSTHLKCFEWGMPPHSGWGFGLDRFMMILTGLKNIREVVLYPRDQFRLLP